MCLLQTVWVQRLVFFFILPLKLIFRQQKWPVQLHRSPSRLKPRISNPPVFKRPSDYPWKSKPVEDSVQKQDRHRDSFVIVTELSSFLRCRGGAVDSRREFPSLCFSTLYLFSGQTRMHSPRKMVLLVLQGVVCIHTHIL